MHASIRIIHEEHRSISAVLHGLLSLVRAASDPGVRPEFAVFHAMIYYIDAFPEREHHPKEDDFLFARLAARSTEAIALVDELRDEPALASYHLLQAVRGDLLLKLGRHAEARTEFERAAALTQNARERELLTRRAAACRSAD